MDVSTFFSVFTFYNEGKVFVCGYDKVIIHYVFWTVDVGTSVRLSPLRKQLCVSPPLQSVPLLVVHTSLLSMKNGWCEKRALSLSPYTFQWTSLDVIPCSLFTQKRHSSYIRGKGLHRILHASFSFKFILIWIERVWWVVVLGMHVELLLVLDEVDRVLFRLDRRLFYYWKRCPVICSLVLFFLFWLYGTTICRFSA